MFYPLNYGNARFERDIFQEWSKPAGTFLDIC